MAESAERRAQAIRQVDSERIKIGCPKCGDLLAWRHIDGAVEPVVTLVLLLPDQRLRLTCPRCQIHRRVRGGRRPDESPQAA